MRLTSVDTFAAGSAGSVLAPQGLDHLLQRHRAGAGGREQGEQGAGLAAAELAPGQASARDVHAEGRGEADADGLVHARSIAPVRGRGQSRRPGPGGPPPGAHAAVLSVPSCRMEDVATRAETPAARTDRVLAAFSEPTRTWFEAAFAEPTPAQLGAWEAVAAGRNALVVAPTGSGKTLSAFLWSLDRIAASPPPEEKLHRCRVLYVSPLKALAVDVERNLRAPLTGIRHTAERLGRSVPDITVGLRSGDTPAADRRRLGTTPPDILITTPESLFLMLTSQARESLRGVETVIVDEVHAVAGTKRGAHLALSLERLDELRRQQELPPAQRIGLSATVRPVEEVARFLGGSRPVEVVAPTSTKEWDLSVVVPVEDMTELALAAAVDEISEGSAAAVGGAAGVDLAARRGARGRPDRGPPLDHRVRQLAAAGRAADRPVQRDRRRPGREPSRPRR